MTIQQHKIKQERKMKSSFWLPIGFISGGGRLGAYCWITVPGTKYSYRPGQKDGWANEETSPEVHVTIRIKVRKYGINGRSWSSGIHIPLLMIRNDPVGNAKRPYPTTPSACQTYCHLGCIKHEHDILGVWSYIGFHHLAKKKTTAAHRRDGFSRSMHCPPTSKSRVVNRPRTRADETQSFPRPCQESHPSDNEHITEHLPGCLDSSHRP